MPSRIDKSDVQGLVRTAFNNMHQGCYYLLRIEDAAAARKWLLSVVDLVNNAVEPSAKDPADRQQAARALQVAFTWEGLQRLGVPSSTSHGFSLEFQQGMAGEPNRSIRLGDVAKNDPAGWQWGSPGKVPHVLVMLFAVDDLEGWKAEAKGSLWATAFSKVLCLDTSHIEGDFEPFGYKDGISQPSIDWERTRTPKCEELDFGNLSAAGEFLLGYPNEYNKYTERPLIDDHDDPHGILAAAEGETGHRDFGLNGTYLVFRDLDQDVSGFWQFLNEQTGGDRDARLTLGAAMVGRTIEGQPLEPLAGNPIAGIKPGDGSLNRFTFDDDPVGLRCPVGAHVRRANPRNADYPPGSKGFLTHFKRLLGFGLKRPDDDLVSSVRFHRILRRGREYGPELKPDAAAKPDSRDGVDRGLRFICLNANITRQFEFVQQAWMMGTKFAGLTEASDPLIGNRQAVPGCLATDTFSAPREAGLSRCVTQVPQFVTVRGGGYFFLPSRRALRYLGSLGT
jgi:deferrochelatase/peroxidase EfeB